MKKIVDTSEIDLWRTVLRAAVISLALFGFSRVFIANLPEARDFFTSLGFWSIPLFTLVYALSVPLLVPHTLLTIMAGAIFGALPGFLSVWVGALIGAALAFSISRALGRSAIEALLGVRLSKWTTLPEKYGVQSIAIARLIPIVPFTGFSYVAGLTSVSLLRYTIGTGVGMTPATIAAVAVGAYGSNPWTWQFLLAISTLILASFFGIIVVNRRKISLAEDSS